MRRWLKRLKAALTLGGFWGAACGMVAAACLGLLQILGGGLAWDLIVESALQCGLAGWVVGSAFAGTLIDFEARGILGRMKSWRIGLWGALMGGVLAPLVVSMTGGYSAIITGLGSSSVRMISITRSRLRKATI